MGAESVYAKQRASAYGDAHAGVYDRIYGGRFDPETAVTMLAETAGTGGRLLELGIGTGRLAIPLLHRGVQVEGIEASPAMIDHLRARPGGSLIQVFRADLAEFELPHRDFDVAVCAVSTFFMLPSRAAQESCLAATARHLRPGGILFIEAFRPDPDRFDANGHRVESRPDPVGTHVVRSHHDASSRCIHISHEFSEGARMSSYDVSLHYATTEELDDMASLAGLSLTGRWHDWTGSPVTATSTDPISIYEVAD